MKTREKERRDSAIIIILILLLGFICIIVASGWALRFAPSWRLDTNMGSNLDPNSDFLTSRPISFIEPLDPAILTNPAWFDTFLTPGASFTTRTPLPLPTGTAAIVPSRTNTPNPIIIASATNTLVVVVSPTNTRVSFPPTPSTVPPTPTASNTPVPSADLQITKNDGVTTYNPGGTLTYTITVRNNGSSNIAGALVTDNIPVQVVSWAWVCTSQNGGATGCDAVASNSVNFTDAVNLPNGASIVYTVTAQISGSATGNLTNTANINIPAGSIDPTPGNNTATDTDTQFIPPSADLQITKDDGVTTYNPGGTLTYTVTISNNGPDAVTGALVTDNIPAQITAWAWTCTFQNGGATGCDAVGSNSVNFTDTVNLPNGASIVYTVTANLSAVATGTLANTATIAVPAGYTDPTPGNNSATDSDTQYIPSADLQITKTDGVITYAAGGGVTYTLTASNPGGPDSVVNATVTDVFSTNTNIASATWTCIGAGGGTCIAGGVGDINDNTVDLPVGSAVTYTVNITISAGATGSLVNTASVSVPVGYTDPNNANNSATDTDQPAGIGTSPDGSYYPLPAGGALTLNFTTVVNGHAGPDIVFYEFLNGGFVYLDLMEIQIGDGTNWYTVFYWGDEIRDMNTNMDYTLLPIPISPPIPPPEEVDEREVPPTSFYNTSGITIDLDPLVPPGTYPFIRIISPPGDVNGLEIDGIEILP